MDGLRALRVGLGEVERHRVAAIHGDDQATQPCVVSAQLAPPCARRQERLIQTNRNKCSAVHLRHELALVQAVRSLKR